AELESDDELRVGLLFAHGDHFTTGLDLADVAAKIAELGGKLVYPDGVRDPWRNDTTWTKPVVAASQGWCITAGVELLLAADIRICASDSRFTQLEVKRGIYPFGGATTRFVREAGWGNAMRWILSGDEFDAAEALRIGIVQEVAEPADLFDRALELAEGLATQSAPLAVRAALKAAHRAIREGEEEASAHLMEDVMPLFQTEDGIEGMMSFVERRPANFKGK
ncbi:MAG: crotonase/enoyl-CoA hydratase family protein, partial [Thermoleophilaceae bacterium]|nr:crotonase/enoyl-CoA hydratase family protein [Thermoleophilaceae bacterium]